MKSLDLTEFDPEAFLDLPTQHPDLQTLCILLEYDPDTPALDFEGLHFGCLRVMNLNGVHCPHLILTGSAFPNLEHLDLGKFIGAIDILDLELPRLKSLSISHIHISNIRELNLSLSSCLFLTKLTLSHVQGLQRGLELVSLPQCEEINCLQSDLSRLILYAPQLKLLTFNGCTKIEELQVLDRVVTVDQVEFFMERLESLNQDEEEMREVYARMMEKTRWATDFARALKWIEEEETWDPENQTHLQGLDAYVQDWSESASKSIQKVFVEMMETCPPVENREKPKIQVYCRDTELGPRVVDIVQSHPRMQLVHA